MGKCRGLWTARQFCSHQWSPKRHDKQYQKAHVGTALKANLFRPTSHTKGIVLGKAGVEVKRLNSAAGRCVRVQFIKNGRKITVSVPSDGCLTFTEENREVFVAGFGPNGQAVGDVPRVLSKAVKGANVLALFKGKKERPRTCILTMETQ